MVTWPIFRKGRVVDFSVQVKIGPGYGQRLAESCILYRTGTVLVSEKIDHDRRTVQSSVAQGQV